MAVKKIVKTGESKSDKPRELTVISKVIRGDTYMVMADAALDLEDEFANLYATQAGSGTQNLALQPPYQPKVLKQLVCHNNILLQCVQAMEVNIDGTGHDFIAIEDEKEPDKTEVEQAKAFFNEPYPGKSFVTIRRALRVDMESIGYGFLEVLRNLAKEVVAVRHLEGQTMRLVRLGNQVQIPYTMNRDGKEIEMKVNERPRRFVQYFGSASGTYTKQYFKEFGCPLELNRETGEWAKEDEKIPVEKQATEVLYFGVDRDFQSPYFVPRWINQLPSVLGSRKAEEQNLEFLDSGGMPPAIIFIQGGTMVGDAANQLRTYLSNGNRKKGRAVVVELASNSGSLDGAAGSVTAKVERFGAEKANDAMYANYDTSCEEHIRVGFRLPPLFIGKSNDYNYATATVAYQVAEAQVFQPERTEFDEIINKTLMKELGFKTIKFKSNPISIKSTDELFKGLALIVDKVEGDTLIDTVNQATGAELTYKEPEPMPEPVQGKIDPHTGLPYDKPVPPPVILDQMNQKTKPGEKGPQPNGKTAPAQAKPVQKQEMTSLELIRLARRYAEVEGMVEPILELGRDEAQEVRETVKKLEGPVLVRFTQMVEGLVTPVHEHTH
jgi:PBSX family phage portal protein